VSDWQSLTLATAYSCEMCGLTAAENFELLKVGFDTLLGNYSNKWVAQSGATPTSPKIDWSTSAWPLLTFSAAVQRLGHHGTPGHRPVRVQGLLGEQVRRRAGLARRGLQPRGQPPRAVRPVRHVPHVGRHPAQSACDVERHLQSRAYAQYLADNTQPGGLNTWLIEEVDWSGRPCNDIDRLGTCNGGSNRENNTVYQPRWDAWMQLLDYVKNYPGGVALTMAEVALAKGSDNAPTVANPDQADSDTTASVTSSKGQRSPPRQSP